MFVCPSIIGMGARTAGPNGTGEASFDAPERRKDYDDSFTVTSVMWHVPRAISQTLAIQNVSQGCRPK